MATTPEQFHNTHAAATEAVPQQEANEDFTKLFNEVLKDNFDQVPRGAFKSNLPGVEWIAFDEFPKTGTDGKKAFYAKIAYQDKRGREKTGS